MQLVHGSVPCATARQQSNSPSVKSVTDWLLPVERHFPFLSLGWFNSIVAGGTVVFGTFCAVDLWGKGRHLRPPPLRGPDTEQ